MTGLENSVISIQGRYYLVKNPNGYGSVAKLSGNRRRPYVVKKTIGYDEKKHPIPNRPPRKLRIDKKA